MIVLALATSAGWGLSPVLIELAEGLVGGPSSTMLLESQSLGLLMLAALVFWRRPPLCAPGAGAASRRRVLLLLLHGRRARGRLLGALLPAHPGDRRHADRARHRHVADLLHLLGGVVLLKERLGARLALAAAITLAGVFLVTVARL